MTADENKDEIYSEKIKENIFTKLGVTRPYTVFVAIAIICILGVFAFTNLRMELFPNMNLPFIIVSSVSDVDMDDFDITDQINSGLWTNELGRDNLLVETHEHMVDIERAMHRIPGLGIRSMQSTASVQEMIIEITYNDLIDMGVEQSVIDSVYAFLPIQRTMLLSIVSVIVEFPQGTDTHSAISQVSNVINNNVNYTRRGFTRPGLMPFSIDMMPIYSFTFTAPDTMSETEIRDFSQRLEHRLNNAQGVVDVNGPFDDQGRRSGFSRLNGYDAYSFSIFMQSGAVTTEVARNIKSVLDEIYYEYDWFSPREMFNQGAFIEESIGDVIMNLVVGGIMAIFILFLFMRSWKITLAVAIAIPLSIVATFVFMYFMGIGLNIVSMSGLALAVGLLIDNSIIVLENIFRLKQKGLPIRDAAIRGASQILTAVIAATLTTISVFFPIFFVSGLMMEMFMDMVWVVILSLLASLVVAIAFLPAIVASFKIGEKREWKIRWIAATQGFFARMDTAIGNFLEKPKATVSKAYNKVLNTSIKWKWATLGLAVVLFAGSFGLAFLNGFELMPAMDTGEFGINVSINQRFDGNFGDLDLDFDGATPNQINAARVLSDELDAVVRTALQGNVQDISITYGTGGMFGFGGGPQLSIDIVLTDGRSMTTVYAQQAAYRAVSRHLEYYGLMPEDYAPADEDYFIRSVSINAAGMAMADDDVTINLGLIRAGDDTVADQEQLEDAINFIVSDLRARPIQGALKIESNVSPSSIRHDDRRMVASISIAIDANARISDVQNAVTTRMNQLMNGTESQADVNGRRGYLYGIEEIGGGFGEQLAGTMTDLVIALFVGMLLVYLVMVAMFQSFKMPFIVMVTVPLAFTGGFIFLWMTGMPLSVVAMIGFVILMGVVTNNGIVMIDYINQRRRDGATIREAVVQGANVRARPIIMNALTTIIAMIPLAIGFGSSGAMMQPMAIANIGGLFYAMFMSLLVVPAFYSIAFFRRDKREQQQLQQQPQPQLQVSGSQLENEQNTQPDARVLQAVPRKNIKKKS